MNLEMLNDLLKRGRQMILFDTFKDTVIFKESSDLKDRYEALVRLTTENPDLEELKEELYFIKKGLKGEEEIEYQLKKSNLGLYVLHDINLVYEDLKAQIDYVVISKMYCYFIECKNLIGNITVNEKGDFIREYSYNNQKVKKGMYSPLRQVEAQRDVFKKLWNNRLSENKLINSIKRYFSENNFTDTYRVLVVAANNETLLNTKYAPKDIKYKVIKADALVRQIEYDLNHSNKDLWGNRKETEKWANAFLKMHVNKNIDYYQYYREKFHVPVEVLTIPNDEGLKENLIAFRKERSTMMNIPAYYIFTNEELDKLLNVKPRTVEELKNANILSDVKINIHGEAIINVINNNFK